MPILAKLKQALDEAKISYEVFNHPLAFTAQEIAPNSTCPGGKSLKSLS